MERARQITFTNAGYGHSPFAYGDCLGAIMDASDRADCPDWFWIMNQGGDPRPEFRPRTDNAEPWGHGLLRRDAFTGEPSQRTLEHLQAGGDPVLEVHAHDGSARAYYPARFQTWEPYTGRIYRTFRSDCYTLIRDWYADRGVVELPAADAGEAQVWAKELGRDFLPEALARYGFEPVARAVAGDLLVIAPPADIIHLGVLVDGGQMLHHPAHRLSCIAPYSDGWKRRTRLALRHRGGQHA